MSVAHPIIASFRVPARVVPLAFLLGACVAPQAGSAGRSTTEVMAEPLALVAREPQDAAEAFLKRGPFAARIAPASPLPGSAEPAVPTPWRLRLTRL